MNTIPLPVDLVQAIANYLAEKPWREVNNLIAGINAAAAPKETPLPEVKGDDNAQLAS